MFKPLCSLSTIAFCNFGLLSIASSRAVAQVTTDNTVDTQVDRNGGVSEITGGETRGDNLFHSFENFSVPANSEAFFNNANNISNIFSRVTGSNLSNIDGTIRTNDASLFLVNPSGILFGAGAKLDLGGGSFYGSTADSILFEDGEFSATDLDNPPLLTINAPIGLSFRDNPAEITNRAVNDDLGLQVAPEANISLIGGDINLEGGLITASMGRIELGGLAESGTIDLAEDGSLNFAGDVAKSNIFLSDSAVVSVAGAGGGFINVNANNLELSNASLFLAGINEGLGSTDAVAGTIQIDSTSITATGESQIRADNLGTGTGGTIDITTDTLDFSSGSAIAVSTFGTGDAGTVNLTAKDISFSQEFSGIYSTVGLRFIETEPKVADAEGNAGVINVKTDTLSLTDGGRILTSTAGMGNAGTVDIEATGKVSFVGGGTTLIEEFGGPIISGADSQARVQSVERNGGEVNIKAGSLEVLPKDGVRAGIIVNSSGTGDVGKINFNVQGNIIFDNALILAQGINPDSEREGNNISFNGSFLEVRGESLIAANNRGTGNAGNISFDIDGMIEISNKTQIVSNVDPGAVGNGGNISFTAEEFNLTNDSEINADTTGVGNAGNISLDIAGDINLDSSSQIQSQPRDDAQGNAGNITINADGSIFSTDGNLILTDSQAQGNSGNISITAAEQIVLEGVSDDGLTSQIVANLSQDTSDGAGGRISIEAQELILDDVAFIASNTVSNSIGSAGEIEIDVDSLSLRNNSYINVFTGNNDNAGAITIDARTLDLFSGGKILAATNGAGDAGNINLNISEQITVNNSVSSSARNFSDRDNASDRLLNDLQSEPSGIYVNATENASGNAGNINIGRSDRAFPNNITVANNGRIVADSEGAGSGGNIFINSKNLQLSNDGFISASTNSGRGGSIALDIAENLTLSGGSLISAEAFNDADGGNLEIDTQFVIAFANGNNDILASAEGGQGGNITINAESLLGIEARSPSSLTNDIDASSEFNLDGNISFNILNFDPIQGVIELPKNIVQSENAVAQTCSRSRSSDDNSFSIEGKGGVPATPESPLSSNNISIDGIDGAAAISQPIETAKGKIQPARGIKVKADGSIALTAYQTNNSGERISESQTNCPI